MKRAVMIILALILLCVPFLLTGCAEDVPSITKADVDAWINANQSIKDLQATKASTADVTTAKNQADAAKKRADEAYTKAENVTAPAVSVSSLNFDNLTDAQITALKNKLGITGGNNNSNSNSNDNNLVASNKSLSLYLTEVNPSMDSLIVSGSQNVRMDFEVKNTDGSSHTYEVTVYLYPTKSVHNYGVAAGDTDIYSDTTINFVSASNYLADATARDDAIIIKLNNGWVGKNDTIYFTLITNVQETMTGSIEFEYDYNIRQTN